jgi:spore coat protein CotH
MPRVWAVERGIITAFLLAAALLFVAALTHGGEATTPARAPAVSAVGHAMPNQGWAPLTAYFSAFGSRSEEAGPLLYEWDLDGNGSFETDASADDGYASTTYAKPGEYRISLRVTDAAGHSAVASTTVLVRHPASSDVDYWTVFDDSRVGRVDLLVSRAAWDRMWEDPFAKTEVEAGAVILGTPVEQIGLSMKGNASLDASGDKKPWKIDVNAFVERQEYQNLPMVLLHNNFADPSMLREALAYEMLRFAGANAAFTRFVEVWIDITDDVAPARYWGVYTMVERPDRRFITNRFGRGSNDGNLYKADAWFEQGAADLAYYGEDIGAYPMPRGRIAYRKMSNVEEADYSDIIDLTRVIDGTEYATPDGFAAALEEVLDVDSYLRYLAATFLHLNLDTYPYTGNNYYLYADPTAGVFRWIAWDENNSWGNFGGDARFPLFGSEQSLGPLQYAPLFVKAFEVDRYRTTYAAYVDLLVRHWFNEAAIGERAQHLHDLLAPFVTASTGDPMYVGSTAMFEPADFDAGWRALVGLTAERSAFIQGELQAFRSGGDP